MSAKSNCRVCGITTYELYASPSGLVCCQCKYPDGRNVAEEHSAARVDQYGRSSRKLSLEERDRLGRGAWQLPRRRSER